jgi:hypothetical protein
MSCAEEGGGRSTVQRNLQLAKEMDIHSTPTAILNGMLAVAACVALPAFGQQFSQASGKGHEISSGSKHWNVAWSSRFHPKVLFHAASCENLRLVQRTSRLAMRQTAMIIGTRILTYALALHLCISLCRAQEVPKTQAVSVGPNLMRLEGVDSGFGIHFVRLLLSLPAVAGSTQTPLRFTVECTESKGKRDLTWFVSFGGVDDIGYVPRFRPSQGNLFPPQNPSASLKMTFEGYMKWKPYTRVWEVLPSGELRYRNPGIGSPNMNSPRFFLQYLKVLSGLRIRFAKPVAGSPPELFFETRPLLDELNKTPACNP